MSYYEQQPQSPAWQQQAQRQSWDTRSTVSTPGQPTFNRAEVHGPPSDLTTRYTAQMKPEDPAAFGSQLDEVERAMDNLVKSGKMFTPPRRESMSLMGPRGFPLEPHNPRMVTPPVRHYPLPAEFDAVRSPSATNLQNFYATQRFQPSRAQEPETMIQAKRRAAAQRERELRNYHQEQQYNRTVLADINPYGKDRVVSPGAMSEEDRRDLIARQHRALYSAQSEGGAHSEDGHHDEGTQRNLNLHSNGASAPTSNNGGTRGPSPMPAFDPFGVHQQRQNGNIDPAPVQTPSTELPASNGTQPGAVSPSHARSISGSPSSSVGFSLTNSRVAGVHGLASRTTASSPGGSPPRSQRGSVPPSSSVAPIGTRPVQNAALNNAKRATTPLASPLSYGFAANEADPFNHQFQQQQNSRPQERSASAASSEQHSSTGGQGGSEGLGWSTKVWGSSGNKGLGMNSMSVWG
ncbi:hypothetical protein EX30DRAFT_162212 [Ascodesmis nigricans]|uniref:Uncharacterized protein n=1 Tax=Ascodesmis nigricans TaxID=341454 RepID=A0A4S2MS11_9PEZI|nr:hypothetical protein EX30DRAFT_162212 [Ascodesmis nigricans]